MAEDLEKDIELEDEEFKLEITEEPKEGEEPKEDEEKVKLQAELAELKKQKEDLEKIVNVKKEPSKDPSLAIAEALKNALPAKKEEEAKVDYNELFRNIDENFYSSPSKSIVSVVTPIVETIDKKYSAVASQQEMNISKLKVLADDSLKGDYIRYKDEVEEMVKNFPVSEEAYSEAVKRVKANHIDDIIEEKLAQKLSEITDKAEKEAEGAKGQLSFTNAGQPQSPAKRVNTVRITPSQHATAKTWALSKGYNWNDPEDREFVVRYLKGQGVL